MICNQLSEASQMFSKLVPQPSASDIVQVVCSHCTRKDTCPSLSVVLTNVNDFKSNDKQTQNS